MLQELMINYKLIGIQEHWLNHNDFGQISALNNEFNYYFVSPMSNGFATGLYRGRPYGGVALVWHKSLNSSITRLSSDPENRCIAIKLSIDQHALIILNAYWSTCSYNT